MPVVKLNGIDIFYAESGDKSKRPLVFLHGFMIDHRMWAKQIESFSKDFYVITPDSRGHGQSEAPPTNYSRSDRVEDVLALIDHLQLEKIDLVGLSMGGTTALGFALDYQDRLNSLTLVGTSAAGYETTNKVSLLDKIAKEKGRQAAIDKLIGWTYKWYPDDQIEIREKTQEMMKVHSGAIWLDPMRGKYPKTNDLDHVHKIKVRTLVACGEDDKMFLPLAMELHRQINNSKLAIFGKTGHMLSLEKPDEFNSLLCEFLEIQ